MDKLLVANRGEIALRIIRSAKLLGIRTVAIYTESEKEAGYVQLADEKVSLGSNDLNATFLNIEKIIQIALSTGSSAIHPGYGFLSENPDFALACQANRLIFVGPEPEVLRLMGNKQDARNLASSLGIPVVSGFKTENLSALSDQSIDFPVLIKASFGGGGKGMKIVENLNDLMVQVPRSSRIALQYFGNGELFIEQYIRNARHVEVQIIGDQFGHLIHLYERECSIQRNHQKIIEEAPALFLAPELREKLLSDAVKIGQAVGYSGAGTVEFLVDDAGNHFFMEMNPRIQVEHAVTEQITGIDIVGEQLKIASGNPLSYTQAQVATNGHAIELRVYAEDPVREFCPSSQPLLSVNLPSHPGIRIEADLMNKHQINNDYDPLLIKLIAHGRDRKSVISLLRENIRNLDVIGPETNIRYLEKILSHDQYQQDHYSVEFCKNHHTELIRYAENKTESSLLPYLLGVAITKTYLQNDSLPVSDPWNYTGYWRVSAPAIPVSVDDKQHKVFLTRRAGSAASFSLNGIVTEFTTENRSGNCMDITINRVTQQFQYHISTNGDIRISRQNIQHLISFPGLLKNYAETGTPFARGVTDQSAEITSHLFGKILEIYVKENQFIKKGDPLLVIESMKTENHILSHKDARVKTIAVKVGAQVTDRMPLLILED